MWLKLPANDDIILLMGVISATSADAVLLCDTTHNLYETYEAKM